MAWAVNWQVLVGGTDVTGNMTPFLMSIDVSDKDGTASDSCRLTFDDVNGQALLPAKGVSVKVLAGGQQIFEGTVDSTPWSLSRGGGRLLTVAAKGFDTRGKAKEGQLWHLDDSTLAQALEKGAQKAGMSVVVDPALGAFQRSYWTPDGASFLAWGQKLAKEMGATFKLRGNQAVFAKRGQGASAVGSAMPTVTGTVGRNVLSVDIDPSKGRPSAKRKRVRFFDRASASFKEKVVDVEGADDATQAFATQRGLASDEDHAAAMADGQKSYTDREAGAGRVELDFDPTAQAEGTFVLTGARPGIDGTYRITGVTHRLDRNGGATTSLDLAQPQGAAGKDTRTPTEGSAVTSVPIPTPAPR